MVIRRCTHPEVFEMRSVLLGLIIALAGCTGGKHYSKGGGDSGGGSDAAPDAPDTTPPTVVAHSPDVNATGVSRSASISVTFSEPVAPATVTTSSYRIVDASNSSVAGSISTAGSNVTFTPAAPLSPSSQYTAAITTDVTDLAGNHLASASSWSFTTGTAGWTAPQLVENNMNMAASHLLVASGGSAVMSVWQMASCNGQGCQNPSQIWYSVLQAGVWSQGAAIPGIVGSIADVRVVVDSQGRATLVYSTNENNAFSVYGTSYANGSWSTSHLLESNNFATSLDVAVDAGGVAYAVWTKSDNTNAQIWGNRFQPGTGWGTAKRIDNVTSSAAGTDFPAVASGPSGSAFAVWTQNGNVYGARFSNGNWGAPSIAGTGYEPVHVTMGSDTSIWAAWTSGNDLMANRNTGAWGTAAAIDAIDATVNSDLVLRTLPDNKTLAIWVQSGDVYQARFDPTQGWGSAFRIENSVGTSNYPTLAVATDGSDLAAWQQQVSASTLSPSYNLFQPSSGWGTDGVTTSTSVECYSATAFYDSQGNNFGALWLAAPTGYAKVYSATYK